MFYAYINIVHCIFADLSEKRLAIVFSQSNFKYRSILKAIFCNLKVNTIKDYKTARKMMRNKLVRSVTKIILASCIYK